MLQKHRGQANPLIPDKGPTTKAHRAAMFIGILQFELLIRASTSLKDKRRVVRSLKDRLHREHLVSIAETEALDHHKLAVMGLAIVSNSRANAEAVLDRVTRKLQRVPDAELGHISREILSGDSATADEPGEDGLPLWTESDRRVSLAEPEHSSGGRA